MSAEFELVEVQGPPHRLIELSGEIDASNAAEFEQRLALLTSAGSAILDLSRVTYFDSAGFAVLDRLALRQSLIVVISPQSVLRRAAALMGIAFHDTVEDASGVLVENR